MGLEALSRGAARVTFVESDLSAGGNDPSGISTSST